MKYSARTRRSLVNTFKKALERVPNGLDQPSDQPRCSPYICDNIRHTSGYPASKVATNFISERIGHMFSIEAWLKNQSEEIGDAVRYDMNYNNGRKLQAYRKAWLRAMIVEFEV